jgi:hypothetical protein
MRKRKIATGLMSLLALAFASAPVNADRHNYNQWASMEFKQWHFTPTWYYYSWYTRYVLGIPITLPGLGIHDSGPGGIGLGDHYVDERWRRMTPLRNVSVAEHTLETERNKKETEEWNDVYQKDMLTIADRNLDAGYSITNDRRNDLIENVDGYATIISDYEKERVKEEKERILSNVKVIRNTHMDNAKKIAAYERESDSLEQLVRGEKLIALLNLTNQIIKGGK